MKTIYLKILIILLSVLHPVFTFGQEATLQSGTSCSTCYEHGHWHMWGGGGYLFGGICAFLFFFILLSIAAKLIFRRRCHSGNCCCGHHHGMGKMCNDECSTWNDSSTSALRILNERLAKGEIQKNEYDEKKAAILS